MKRFVVAAMSILLPYSAAAHADGLAVSLHESFEGRGIELTKRYAGTTNVRFGYHQYSFKGTDPAGLVNMLTIKGILSGASTYDHDAKQHIIFGIADWYPGDGQSRFSVGLLYNKSDDKLTGRGAVLGGYTLNGTHYTSAEVGDLTGTVSYNRPAPYFGVGWGNAVAKDKSWGFMLDIGMMYQGKPSVKLHATGTAPGLQADLAGEEIVLRDDAYVWAPLASLGISYQW